MNVSGWLDGDLSGGIGPARAVLGLVYPRSPSVQGDAALRGLLSQTAVGGASGLPQHKVSARVPARSEVTGSRHVATRNRGPCRYLDPCRRLDKREHGESVGLVVPSVGLCRYASREEHGRLLRCSSQARTGTRMGLVVGSARTACRATETRQAGSRPQHPRRPDRVRGRQTDGSLTLRRLIPIM